MVGHADGSDDRPRAARAPTTEVRCTGLSAVASWLVPVNGQRKALLLFGEGLSGDSVERRVSRRTGVGACAG